MVLVVSLLLDLGCLWKLSLSMLVGGLLLVG